MSDTQVAYYLLMKTGFEITIDRLKHEGSIQFIYNNIVIHTEYPSFGSEQRIGDDSFDEGFLDLLIDRIKLLPNNPS